MFSDLVVAFLRKSSVYLAAWEVELKVVRMMQKGCPLMNTDSARRCFQVLTWERGSGWYSGCLSN